MRINKGKTSVGSQRGVPRSGQTAGREFIEDGEKRKQTLYQRKKTLFNKVMVYHLLLFLMCMTF